MKNCPSLNRGVCAELSERLGWAAAVGTDVCSRCNGPSDVVFLTKEGEKIEGVLLSSGDRMPAAVVIKLAERYPDRVSKEMVKAAQGWDKVKSGWEKGASFAKSLMSTVGGPISLPVLQGRHVACHGTTLNGGVVGAACQHREKKNEGEYYCGACGCGERELARLDRKLEFPYLECPIARPSFSNGSPSEVKFSDHGGMGDLCLHAWHAEGYKKVGGKASFHSVNPTKIEFLQLLGQRVTEDPSGMVVTGGQSIHLAYENRVDKGKNPRAIVWGKVLGMPIARPTVTVTRRMGDPKGVVLFPRAEWGPRQWPRAYWLDLAWQLHGRGWNVTALGPEKNELLAFPHFEYGHGWKHVMEVMSGAALVVGNDSGPCHLAGTMGLNTVAIMGPTKNVFTHYQTVREVAQSKEVLPCSGCHFDAAVGFRAACDVECRSLMTMLPEAIVEVCEEAIANPLTYVDPWEIPNA